jgi:hypothetical protein
MGFSSRTLPSWVVPTLEVTPSRLLGDRDEGDPVAFEDLYHVREIGERPRQAIDLVDHCDVGQQPHKRRAVNTDHELARGLFERLDGIIA